MKIFKFFKILLISLFVFLAILYISIPTIIKTWLPDYIISKTGINEIKLKKTYYKNFNVIHVDNAKLKIKKDGFSFTIVIPKNIIKVERNNLFKKYPSMKLIHPIVLGKIDITEYKNRKQKKNIKEKFNLNIDKLNPILKNLSIKKGDFLFRSIKTKKIDIKDTKGNFTYKNKNLYLNNINTKIFQGTINGNTHIIFNKKDIVHKSYFKIKNINIKPLIDSFEKNKYKLTGKYTGDISITGTGTKIKQLSGNLTSSDKGGKIDIEEEKIENFLKGKSDNLKLAIKQLENFAYDNGSVKIKSLNNNLLIRTIFKGKQGTKDIEFVIHDIFN